MKVDASELHAAVEEFSEVLANDRVVREAMSKVYLSSLDAVKRYEITEQRKLLELERAADERRSRRFFFGACLIFLGGLSMLAAAIVGAAS